MTEIVLTDESTRFILYQRSQHLRFTKTSLYKWLRSLTGLHAIRPISYVEAILRKTEIHQAYREEMAAEFESILPFLPDPCHRILDIGCGLGVINLHVHRHYEGDEPSDYYLLDRTDLADGLSYGFKNRGEFYNSLSLTKALLSLNGIPERSIHLIEAPCDLENEIPNRLDLVLSLISWGFHYPLSTYLDPVCTLLNPEGRLILDIRAGTDGIEQLRERFSKVETLFEDRKRTRVLATR